MILSIRIVRPSSREKESLLPDRVRAIEAMGHKVSVDDRPVNPQWPFVAASRAERLASLTSALLDEAIDVILAARGGYGASDLLPDLPWDKIKNSKPKKLVGFSDICALHSALMIHAGWFGIHAPMTASTLWPLTGGPDIAALFAILEGRIQGHRFPVSLVGKDLQAPLSGPLFGGNLSVLTNLIGTPWFPKSLAGAIVFLEDVGENPGRLMRQFNQWIHAGVLKNVKALLIGGFTDLGRDNPDHDPRLIAQFVERSHLPCFSTQAFGHIAPNHPIQYGAIGTLTRDELNWTNSTTERLV